MLTLAAPPNRIITTITRLHLAISRVAAARTVRILPVRTIRAPRAPAIRIRVAEVTVAVIEMAPRAAATPPSGAKGFLSR